MNSNGEKASPDSGRVAYLINGFLQDNLTDGERDELDEWIEAAPENMRLFEELTDEENLQAAQVWYQGKEAAKNRKDKRYQSIQKRIGNGVHSLVWYLAAACVVGLCFGIYFLTRNDTIEKPSPVAQATDAKPEGNNVVLRLANGKMVSLDSNRRVTESAYTIENGVLSYSETASSDTGFNSVYVPAGNQFRIKLRDGSEVWLNAGTTIRFPVAFGTSQRIIDLNGEAYFEVVHDAAKPFIVQTSKQIVTDLGTKFNVSAYDEDSQQVTTLVQGSVKVSAGSTQKVLIPGQQSAVEGGRIKVHDVDAEEVVAWTSNLFLFRSASIETVVSQLQRWYGLDVEYAAKPSVHLNATIKRSESLQRALQVLEGTGYVHFKLEGKKLTVTP